MKALKSVEAPERVDGKTPEAYQVSYHHFYALLELTNGDMEGGYITREELAALQVAGYCNVVKIKCTHGRSWCMVICSTILIISLN
jgi:hypothetical protein